jgi:HSP20 family protein
MSVVKKNTGWFPETWNRLFDWEKGLFPGSLLAEEPSAAMEKAMQLPSVNIAETDSEFHLDLAMPGKKKEDFKLKVENGSLTISSEKKEEKEEQQKDFHRREFSYNYFSRSFRLPQNSEPDKMSAKYEDGILKVVLPKKEVAQARPSKEIKVD